MTDADIAVEIFSEQHTKQLALKITDAQPVRLPCAPDGRRALCEVASVHLRYLAQTFTKNTTLPMAKAPIAVIAVTVHGVHADKPGIEGERTWRPDSLDWPSLPEWIAELVEQHRPAWLSSEIRT